MKKKIKKILAYICMPVLLGIIGYKVLYSMVTPLVDIAISDTSMIVSDEIPKFSKVCEVDIDVEKKIKKLTKESEERKKMPDKVKASQIKNPKQYKKYAQISCKRIKMDAPVYMGDDQTILRAGVGQYEKSSLPGYNKKILLAGHCTTYFAPLEYIKKGDIVQMVTSYGVYKYKINRIKIVSGDLDKAYTEIDDDSEKLIMYTCYPFSLLATPRSERLFVYGEKISGPKVVNNNDR